MRSFLLFAALVCVLTLAMSSVPSVTSASGIPRFQRAEVNFASPVELMGVTLQGHYLFVHDDQAMANGDACTFVYKGLNEKPKNDVATFHCMPAGRNKVAYFTVRTAPNVLGQLELREFQFAGSTEAHLVPVHQHSVHVSIAP